MKLKFASRFENFYKAHAFVRLITPISYIIAVCFTFGSGFIDLRQEPSFPLIMKVVFTLWLTAEISKHALSVLIARYGIKYDREACKLERVGTLKRQKHLCSPPQVLRWDIIGVCTSRLFGFVASITIPKIIRYPFFRLVAWYGGVNLEEVDGELSSFSSCNEFFTRPLVKGARPISESSDLVSPVDGKVVIFGESCEGKIEQVKGVTYDINNFFGTYERPNL